MKNRTTLVLMEQLVMILVFALAAAICLQLFVGADRISRQTLQRDRAVEMASNGAETVKAAKGELSTVAAMLDGTLTDGSVLVETEGLSMRICLLPEEQPGLGQAQVQVLDTQTGGEVFCLCAGWQEVRR